LLIVCHGTRPFDYPLRQIQDWVRQAEELGFLVAAPSLDGTSADLFRKVEDQLDRQRRDERHILNVVRHIRGGYNISEDRIFLTGWSAGNYAVLHTGLRHSDVFRALALLQGNFDATYMADVTEALDPHQPVLVLYGATDLLRGDAKAAAEWLEDQGALMVRSEIGGGHAGHPREACEFFRKIVNTVPWMHIRAIQTREDPYRVQFKILSSFEPTAFRWAFGDGNSSPVARPVHTYAQAGTYRVTLDAQPERGSPVRRTVDVEINPR
jgi:predicted esterase